jgi:hypothetical protein
MNDDNALISPTTGTSNNNNNNNREEINSKLDSGIQKNDVKNGIDDGSSSDATTTTTDHEIDDDEIDDDEVDNNSMEDTLPLFYYQRQKKIPYLSNSNNNNNNNNNSVYCTTSIMGKVILNSTTTVWTPISTSSSSTTTTTTAATSLPTSSSTDTTARTNLSMTSSNTTTNTIVPNMNQGVQQQEFELPDDTTTPTKTTTTLLPPHIWYNQTIYIVVCGYSNGQIGITEATTNTPIMDMSNSSSSSTDQDKSNTTSFNSMIGNNNNNNNTNLESVLSNAWYVTTNKEKISPIVSVSIDATGTVITGIDRNGNCSIWTIKYTIQNQTAEQQRNTATTAIPKVSSPKPATTTSTSSNILTKLFWRKDTSTTEKATTTNDDNATITPVSDKEPKRTIPMLTMIDVKVNRLQPYSETLYGIPTSICLDPQFNTNYKLVVGFHTGKIVVTTRNWMRRFEEHTILPYYINTMIQHKINDYYYGIETIIWRHTIIAFADSSGIKLYDIQLLKPIAHVDRPIGAQPSLYYWGNNTMKDNDNNETMNDNNNNNKPLNITEIKSETLDNTLNDVDIPLGHVKPHLYFETSRSLLVAWGDCLMTLTISDSANNMITTVVPATSDNTTSQIPTPSNTPMTNSGSNNNNNSLPIRKRIVTCTMAWELDGIVAADVVPIDERHLAILGHVLWDDDDENNDHDKEDKKKHLNQRLIPNPYEMEIQILDRINGSILYADLLQLQQPVSLQMDTVATNATVQQQKSYICYNQNCRLLSSFSLPRMDDVLELKEEKGENIFDIIPTVKFVDSHLKWNLNMVAFQNYIDDKENITESKYEDDTDSVDSDDYDFVFRVNKNSESDTNIKEVTAPPILMIVSDTDTVLARVRDLDDAIHFALERNKPALALRHALSCSTHQLRRHKMNDLINTYLRSLLRIPNASNASLRKSQAKSEKPKSKKVHAIHRLSLRRMTLAAQSLPFLLGGNVEMWNFWISELEKIPGALFVVRKYIPVRGK